MRIRLAAKKKLTGSFKQRFWGVVTKIFTGKFIHTEIELPGRMYDDNCFSASEWSDPAVRFKHITFSHPDHWDFLPLPDLTYDQVAVLRERLSSFVGKEYDRKGAICSGLLIQRHINPDKWFCSEICAHTINMIFQLAGVRGELKLYITPTRLVKEVKRIMAEHRKTRCIF